METAGVIQQNGHCHCTLTKAELEGGGKKKKANWYLLVLYTCICSPQPNLCQSSPDSHGKMSKGPHEQAQIRPLKTQEVVDCYGIYSKQTRPLGLRYQGIANLALSIHTDLRQTKLLSTEAPLCSDFSVGEISANWLLL